MNFLTDLCSKLDKHKTNVVAQIGTSDIEPQNNIDEIESWYCQIIKIIHKEPPKDYVIAVNIVQDAYKRVKKIEYVYCNNKSNMEQFSINLFWG